MIESLLAGRLGLPAVLEPLYTITVDGEEITILHPSILILTKLKRWSTIRTSTRPQTVAKVHSDKSDIEFLIKWMSEHDMAIEFEKYQGQPKEKLVQCVRVFYRQLVQEDVTLAGTLMRILKEEGKGFMEV